MHEHRVVTTTIPVHAAPAFDGLLMDRLAATLAVRRPRLSNEPPYTLGVVNEQDQLYRLFMCFGEGATADVAGHLESFGLQRRKPTSGAGHADVDAVYAASEPGAA